MRAVASVWPYITTRSQPAWRPSSAYLRTRSGVQHVDRAGPALDDVDAAASAIDDDIRVVPGDEGVEVGAVGRGQQDRVAGGQGGQVPDERLDGVGGGHQHQAA